MSQNRLDIIVFSRGRENLLQSSLDFWGKQNFRFIILHNSKEGLPSSEFPANITYVSCKGIDFAGRAAMASKMLTSEYSLILADDERLNEIGLSKMLTVFDEDTSIASVGGRTISIMLNESMVKVNFPYKQMMDYKNIFDSPTERLHHHFRDPDMNELRTGAMYRIYRRREMQDMLTVFGNFHGISTPYCFQYAAEFLASYYGKSMYLNELYWIRNWDVPMVSGKNWNRKIMFSDWWKNNLYSSEKEKFCKALSLSTNFSSNEIREYFSEISESIFSHETRNLQQISSIRARLSRVYHKTMGKYRDTVPGASWKIDVIECLRKEWPELNFESEEATLRAIESLFIKKLDG